MVKTFCVSPWGEPVLQQAFLDEGDALAVELPTWEAVVGSAQRLGAEPLAVPVDGDGLRVDLLEKQLEALRAAGRRHKFVYTIATFPTPPGVCRSLERRHRLLSISAKMERFKRRVSISFAIH